MLSGREGALTHCEQQHDTLDVNEPLRPALRPELVSEAGGQTG